MRKVSAVLAIVFVLYALPDLVGEHEVVYRIFRVGKEGPIWMESHKDVNLERGEPSMGSIVPMPPLSSEYDYELETLIDGELWGERTPYSIEDREALRREIPEDTGEISETEAVGLVIQGPSETNNTLLQNSLGIGFGSGDPTAQLDVRSGHVRIWDGGATPGYANLAGDLFIANELEVDGTVYSTNWRDAAGNPMLAGGTDISVSEDANGQWTINNTNPDQTVAITAGTGINVTGSYPSFTVANTVPDQTVALTGGTGISITGTYPNFTVTNSSPSSGGTLTSIATSSPITGGTITTTGTIGLQQQGDIIGGTDVTVTGGTDILPGTDADDVTISFSGSTGDTDWTISGTNMYSGVTGNVGIGTTTPTAKLDVVGQTANIGQGNTLTFPTGYGANITIGATNDITGGRGTTLLGHDNTASADFCTILGVRNTISSGVSGGHAFGLDNTVGAWDAFSIGSHVVNNITNSLQFGWNSSDGPGVLTIRDSGNIGIRTTAPASDLDVNGTIRADHYRDNAGGNLLNPGSGIGIAEQADGSWTVTNTSPSSGGTVTSIATSAPITGGTITTSGTIGLTQTGDVLGGTGISISGGTNVIPGTSNVTISNSAPDQTVTLSAGTGISVSGTYPNFTVTNTSPGVADNLGNHSATMDLDMNSNDIYDIGYLSTGSSVTSYPRFWMGPSWTELETNTSYPFLHISNGGSGSNTYIRAESNYTYLLQGSYSAGNYFIRGDASGNVNVRTNLTVGSGITLGGVYRTTWPSGGATENLSTTLAAGNSAGSYSINMNSQDITNVDVMGLRYSNYAYVDMYYGHIRDYYGAHGGTSYYLRSSSNSTASYVTWASVSGGASPWTDAGTYLRPTSGEGVYLGDATSDNNRWYGTFQAGTTSDSHIIRPNSAFWSYVGNYSYYWYYTYTYYDRYRSEGTFDTYDDLALLDQIVADVDTVWDPILEHHIILHDEKNLPACITNYGERAADPDAPIFVDAGRALGLTFGSIRQLNNEAKDRDKRLIARTDILADAAGVDFAGNTVRISDFGTAAAISGRIEFSSDFSERLRGVNAVVTATPTSTDIIVAVTDVDESGFVLQIAGETDQNTKINWIAMAETEIESSVEHIDDVFWRKSFDIERGNYKEYVPYLGEIKDSILSKDPNKVYSGPIDKVITDNIARNKGEEPEEAIAYYDNMGNQIPPEWVDSLKAVDAEMYTKEELNKKALEGYLYNAKVMKLSEEKSREEPSISDEKEQEIFCDQSGNVVPQQWVDKLREAGYPLITMEEAQARRLEEYLSTAEYLKNKAAETTASPASDDQKPNQIPSEGRNDVSTGGNATE